MPSFNTKSTSFATPVVTSLAGERAKQSWQAIMDEEISAEHADWSREIPHCFWDPGRKLLHAIRQFQFWKMRRGVISACMCKWAAAGRGFWCTNAGADISSEARLVAPHRVQGARRGNDGIRSATRGAGQATLWPRMNYRSESEGAASGSPAIAAWWARRWCAGSPARTAKSLPWSAARSTCAARLTCRRGCARPSRTR
jgi:hypothetical protein